MTQDDGKAGQPGCRSRVREEQSARIRANVGTPVRALWSGVGWVRVRAAGTSLKGRFPDPRVELGVL